MLRNLVAIIPATIAGLAVAKVIESLLSGGVTPSSAVGLGYQLALTLGYLTGAFAAAAIALVIGKRWAPIGWLASATIFFAAVITMVTFSLPLLLWPLSLAACMAGGWLAIRLLKATNAPARRNEAESLFD